MHLLENVSLASYTTFGFDAQVRYLIEVDSIAAIQQVVLSEQWKSRPMLVLGGGSNILCTSTSLEHVVVRVVSKGIKLIKEDEAFRYIEVQGGEVWDNFVQYCVDHGYGGVENLSLIPGTVGASPMQNIGAYGVELQQVFDSLVAVNRQSGALRTFTKEECQFGYRESVFKKALKEQYIIATVTFKLPKKHEVSIEYGDIQRTLVAYGISNPTIQDVRRAVIDIRMSKLPNPAEIGNAGSFFKNPIIATADFLALKSQYPTLPGYATADENWTKVAAGWLIEQAGWKGYKEGHVGVHDRQALVLVHFGQGVGQEIVILCEKIQQSVKQKFGIELTPEVNFVG